MRISRELIIDLLNEYDEWVKYKTGLGTSRPRQDAYNYCWLRLTEIANRKKRELNKLDEQE